MATIKDIAKAAGVSHGTVSNVMNGRGNVSAKKIQLVEEAARKLGYKINYTAQSLRSGVTKSISIIIPSIESEEYSQMYKGLDKTLSQLGYRTHLYITYDLPLNEKNILKEIAEERVTGIITISCLDDASIYYNELDIPQENIIFVNREIKNGKSFVSFDFVKAGMEIGRYLSDNQFQTIGIFADEQKFSNERQLAEMIAGQLQGSSIKIIHVPLNHSYGTAFEFFEDESPEIIVASSLSRAQLLKNANYYGSAVTRPQILCLAPTESTFDDQLKKYRQNYQMLGHHIANLLINQVNQQDKPVLRMIFENSGLDSVDGEVVKNENNITLTMLTIPSPTTDALKKLLPHFTKETGIKVLLAIHTYEEIYQILTDHSNNRFYDIIRMDMAWLAWFGKDVFHPLKQLDRELDEIINALPLHIKDNYMNVEGTAYTFPFDPSVQMLFYRKDLFEDQMIKRMYFEKYKKHLTVPTDYTSYNELVKFFSRSCYSDSPTLYGTSVTLGRSEIIALEFLIRYYAEGGRLISENGLRLDPPIATKALENFMDTLSVAQKLNESWWGESVNSFARGETAMVIGFMNHVSRIAHSEVGTFIGSAPVPGNAPLLGGGVIGISKNSKKIKEAVRFIKWVNQTGIAEQISLLGGTTANPEVSDNYTIRTLYPWLQEANKWSSQGIRETKGLDGTGIDTKRLELIIGLSIKKALQNILNIEETIEHINVQLANSFL
ncbi:extracellular solute-binding protein [Paenibacillus monticola]|uniref:Extracellular solute-binding protein n=1 Tax=Paenibacillus monticola TaxID=2666075 RepID=A0A7X2H2H1_9BACL|nr:extracellular solute-binding protein [Paenibacillus monticola]MRN52295.1 extracellular solute-binding protein [Paenibacillus monticola]